MIIIDDDDIPRKRQPTRSGTDEPLPHTALLDDALNTEIEMFDCSSSPSLINPSRETPAPLPPSYEASIQVERDQANKSKRRRQRLFLIPAVVFLNIVLILSILLPRKFRVCHWGYLSPRSDFNVIFIETSLLIQTAPSPRRWLVTDVERYQALQSSPAFLLEQYSGYRN